MKKFIKIALIIGAVAFCAFLKKEFYSAQQISAERGFAFPKKALKVPLGLHPVPWPQDNPYTPEKAQLGLLLYFDPRVSSDGSVSCASCHQARHAYADVRPLSIGIHGHLGQRHAPTVINTAYSRFQFWDGRAKSLEEQSKGPIANPKEMTNFNDPHTAYMDCQNRIKEIKGYRSLFKKAFGNEECHIEDIARAIATFERTILSGNSSYDRYIAGDKTALTSEQIHGLEVFKKSHCNACHAGFNFTDGTFTNIGVAMDADIPDPGRYDVTKVKSDYGSFKVPTLREVSRTSPYMHDGSIETLSEVIEFYDKGGIPNSNLHPLMKPLHLTDIEKKDLVLFLESLNGEGWQHFTPPATFPE
jgi:cytochrome c peroxidase